MRMETLMMMMLMDWLKEADIVFAVGKTVEDELIPYILALHSDKRPVLKLYLPSYPLELFTIKPYHVQDKIIGNQNVSIMNRAMKDLHVTGLDFSCGSNCFC